MFSGFHFKICKMAANMGFKRKNWHFGQNEALYLFSIQDSHVIVPDSHMLWWASMSVDHQNWTLKAGIPCRSLAILTCVCL